jgi:CRISPR-associated protein Csm3
MKLISKLKVNAKLTLMSGLHIGDSSDNIEIGGIDKTIIRSRKDNIPYIPGSSLKGKIRSLLEQIAGASEVGKIPEINSVFGFAANNQSSKVIFRDSYLDKESKIILESSEFTDMPYSEIKMENSIERITGTATNPRKIERIPAGVSFDVEIIINVWDKDEDGQKSLAMLKKGIHALENDYLGGSGSRGYGQVRFSELKTETIAL